MLMIAGGIVLAIVIMGGVAILVGLFTGGSQERRAVEWGKEFAKQHPSQSPASDEHFGDIYNSDDD